MAFCTSCGANIADSVQFCTSCGAKMAGAAPGAAAAARPAQPHGSNVLKIVLIVIAACLVVGILGAVGMAVFVGKKIHDAGVSMVEKDGEAKIKLPGVTVETTKDPEKLAEDLGIDIYPGATMREGGAAMQFGNVNATNGVFETEDAPEKVAEFYRERLPGAHYTVAEGAHTIIGREGKDMITIHIERDGGKTSITLARTRGLDTN